MFYQRVCLKVPPSQLHAFGLATYPNNYHHASCSTPQRTVRIVGNKRNNTDSTATRTSRRNKCKFPLQVCHLCHQERYKHKNQTLLRFSNCASTIPYHTSYRSVILCQTPWDSTFSSETQINTETVAGV